MHGWGFDTPKRLKQEVASIHAIGERVGSKMAIRNADCLEWGLVHPRIDTWSPEELYVGGFKSGLHSIDSDGCIAVT